jgi:hypothetical protein
MGTPMGLNCRPFVAITDQCVKGVEKNDASKEMKSYKIGSVYIPLSPGEALVRVSLVGKS